MNTQSQCSTTFRQGELVPIKLLYIIQEILNRNSSVEVWNVVFEKDKPTALDGLRTVPVLGHFHHPTRSIIINLNFHFEEMDEHMSTNILRGMMWLWHQLLITVHHELYHAWEFTQAGFPKDFRGNCASADEWAFKQVFELAKEIDLEPPRTDRDNSYIWTMMREWEDDLVNVMDEKWARYQSDLAITNKAYRTKGGLVVEDFRTFLRISSADEDAGWDKDVKKIVIKEKTTTPKPTPKIDEDMTPPSKTTVIDEDMTPPSKQVVEDMTPPSKSSEPPIIKDSIQPTVHEGYYYAESIFESAQHEVVVDDAITVNPSDQSPLTVEEQVRCAAAVFARCHEQLFAKCDFKLGGFENPGGILDPIYIDDILHSTVLFNKCETVDAHGRVITMDIWPSGKIKGRILPGGKLPSYRLFLKTGHQRDIKPQNPDKKDKDGNLTVGAKMAIGGKKMSYVYRKEDDKMSFSYQGSGTEICITYDPFGDNKRIIK